MATVQKTVLKRYNGVDWDAVYLATASDITYLGTGFTIAVPSASYNIGDAITSGTSMAELIEAIVNKVVTIDKNTIPGLANGTGINTLDVSKLSGVISTANLPASVTQATSKAVTVASEAEKNALTAADINQGDFVKITDGKFYYVSSVSPTITFISLTDAGATISWANVQNAPTTLAGYGITDAVRTADVVTEAIAANAGKIISLNSDGKLDVTITGGAANLNGHTASYFATATGLEALNTSMVTAQSNIGALQTEIKAIDGSWITTGTIPIERFPPAALERLYVAATEAALANLTVDNVQNGDTIKVTETNNLYYVIDQTKLGTTDYMNALMVYSTGVASAVDWSGIMNKPTTLEGFGITDAVNSAAVVTVAAASKLLLLDSYGRLPASITGSAAQLGGKLPSYYASADDLNTVASRVTDAETNINTLTATVGNANSGLVKAVTANTNAIGSTATEGSILNDIVLLKAGTAVNHLAATKLTGTVLRDNLPSDISGRLILKDTLAIAESELTTATASIGDLLKLADGKVFVVTDTGNLNTDLGYTKIIDIGGDSISWSQITDIPTTLATMGWADAVTTGMVVDAASIANAGKLVKINESGKLATDITGDAGTLGGYTATHFATAADMSSANKSIQTNTTDITGLKTTVQNLDAAAITTGTIGIDRLPHGTLERCVVIANDTARYALTTDTVQTGDTVKVTSTGMMYFVVDDTKLAEAAGYEVYTAGTASAVDWSGIVSKPTTLGGYGITDAVSTTYLVTEASAANVGKIIVLNADGKLDVSITGNVDWANINNKPTSTIAAIDTAVTAATHTNRALLDLLASDASGHLTYNGAALAYKSELDAIATGSLSVSSTLPTDADTGQLVLEQLSTT